MQTVECAASLDGLFCRVYVLFYEMGSVFFYERDGLTRFVVGVRTFVYVRALQHNGLFVEFPEKRVVCLRVLIVY